MRRFIRLACATALSIASVVPTASVAAQTPSPNLYTWLRTNSNWSSGTTNFVWYWGCAAGLPGACQYVALGPIRSAYPVMALTYGIGLPQTPSGIYYSFYDNWGWSSPSEGCSGYDDRTYVPKTCAPYLQEIVWSGRVDTFVGAETRSYNATFRAVSGATVTPEPATLLLLGSGLAGLGGFARWRRKAARSTTA